MIYFDTTNNTITLQTVRSTYQMKIDSNGVLLHTYYGQKIGGGDMSYRIQYLDRGFSPNPAEAGHDRCYSLDTLPQEFASSGVGDFRIFPIELEAFNGGYAADFRYVRHVIQEGKYTLEGLPAFYDTEQKAQTLVVTMRDACTQVELDLLYGVFEEDDMITRAAIVRNQSDQPVKLRRIMSLCLDLPDADSELLTLGGAYAREREPVRSKLTQGKHSVGSVRGLSSHQHNPFLAICRPETTEDSGECIGMALAYSGNFLLEAQRTQFDNMRVTMGIHPYRFCFLLNPGDCFTAPEAAMVYSCNGLTEMSHKFHRMIRNNLCRGKWQHKPRPLLINNWEATEFHFNADKIISIAEKAASVGIEMMVMDDGWFGHRENDLGGLGDWNVNEEKLPGGLKPLVERIKALGMRFGIWVEPEMISEDSDLYAVHPEWAFQIPNRPPTRGRSQLVMDLTRKEVRDYIRNSLKTLLDSADISYLKWDMNRSMSDVWSSYLPADRQGEVYHRYILGLYEILEWLNQEYPDLLIEGCSGGGGRFDCGMLYYEPQIWCSDNTDAIDRLRIQYGTSFCYPASAVGAHVSAVPNGMTKRSVPIHTRGIVAMSGTFGYELDLNELDEADLEEVRNQIIQYKKYCPLIMNGDAYRLTNPFLNVEYMANMFVSPDKTCALVSIVQNVTHANPIRSILRLKGLNPDATYRMNDGSIFRGDQLMYAGIHTPILGEYEATLLYLEQISV